jgi:hypothetical protein
MSFHPSLQRRGLPGRANLLAGNTVPMAAAACLRRLARRRRVRPPTSATKLSLSSMWSSPASSPASPTKAHRNSTGPPPAAPRGPHCENPNLPGGPSVNRGHNCKISKPPGTSLQISIFNSICVLLDLVKSIENRRKSANFKPNFVGFLVKSTTTFVKLVYAFP